MRFMIGLLWLTSGCVASHTAFRAPVEPGEAGDGTRECAQACISTSQVQGKADECLAQCPGFVAHPGEQCGAGPETPGTLCVTVENRIYPDVAFWAGVVKTTAEIAAESGSDKSDDDDDDDDKGDSASHSTSRKTSASSKPAHTPARARAKPAEKTRTRRH